MDHYVVYALLSYIERACEEHESVLTGSPDTAKRIPQIGKAYEHLQAAEHLLNEAVIHVDELYKDSTDTNE